MVKNIVICCDGTANEFAKDRTNLIKLYSTLMHDTDRQTAYYHPGIGTMEPFGALSPVTRKLTRILGSHSRKPCSGSGSKGWAAPRGSRKADLPARPSRPSE